jgi:NAD(P)-dependent dehydrogenase (short-subunit alcohol dehydrogenase family)
MAVICITGSSDGIGLATARVLLAAGHRILIHARSRDRGQPVLEQLGGEVALVTGDLARLDGVHGLADQIQAQGPVDVLVHNAGVWVRGSTPRTTADGLETTFAVNVLAPHLLTHLLAEDLRGRLLWLGSGTARSGRPDPATLGQPQEPSRAYADSKACDVALALAWGRRLTKLASAAVDPGWVKTKLASAGAPGDVTSSADTLAFCCTKADLASAPYWKTGHRRQSPNTCATRRCKTPSPQAAIGWQGSTDRIRASYWVQRAQPLSETWCSPRFRTVCIGSNVCGPSGSWLYVGFVRRRLSWNVEPLERPRR